MSELLKINVNDHTEKKGQLTYLSWAWAWAEILKIDPAATWEAHEFNGMPVCILPDNTAMTKVSVTVKGDRKTSWLPVMDNRNKAIQGPDAFQINTSIMRCLAKAIAMHGLGLYIYAGEDLPEGDANTPDSTQETPIITPRGGIGDDLPDEVKESLRDIAMRVIADVKANKIADARSYVTAQKLEADQKTWLWNQLDSKTRSALTPERKVPANQPVNYMRA